MSHSLSTACSLSHLIDARGSGHWSREERRDFSPRCAHELLLTHLQWQGKKRQVLVPGVAVAVTVTITVTVAEAVTVADAEAVTATSDSSSGSDK